MCTFSSIRRLLEPWGELKPQPVADWCGDISLPALIARLYSELGPWGKVHHESVGPIGLSISAGGNPVNVPPLHKLWNAQNGYRFNGSPSKPLPGWQDHWLVVAQEGANPFIFDCHSEKVLFDMAGTGKWQPQEFANDLPTALGAIATVANELNALEDDAYDNTYELKATARTHIIKCLADFVGTESQALHMLNIWRWYT
jgi:hypothetical protein